MRRRRGLAVALASVAGFVDVVGYLTLRHLFTAHMTGNASRLGLALGRGELGAAVPLVVAPALFVVGIGAGTLLLDAGSRWQVLALESALVAGYMGYGVAVVRHGAVPSRSSTAFYVLASLAILGLGLQTAALTEIEGETVRTTYLSGMLTKLAQAAARRLAGTRREASGAGLRASTWLAYVGGAAAGAVCLHALAFWCLAAPLAVLAAAAAVEALLRPR